VAQPPWSLASCGEKEKGLVWEETVGGEGERIKGRGEDQGGKNEKQGGDDVSRYGRRRDDKARWLKETTHTQGEV